MAVNLRIETEHEDDGRWIAEIPDLPGDMVHGASRDEAVSRVKVLTLRAPIVLKMANRFHKLPISSL